MIEQTPAQKTGGLNRKHNHLAMAILRWTAATLPYWHPAVTRSGVARGPASAGCVNPGEHRQASVVVSMGLGCKYETEPSERLDAANLIPILCCQSALRPLMAKYPCGSQAPLPKSNCVAKNLAFGLLHELSRPRDYPFAIRRGGSVRIVFPVVR